MRRLLVVPALVGLIACQGTGDSEARRGTDREQYRRVQREFDGAPPVIPHAVVALARQECLACHEAGMDLGEDGLAATTPHPERVLCQQCHVEQIEPEALLVSNSFVGWRHPRAGTRAFAGAPPTIPHPLNGREGCLGCHGDLGGSPIQTPHADRVNCRQCHVSTANDASPYTPPDYGGRP